MIYPFGTARQKLFSVISPARKHAGMFTPDDMPFSIHSFRVLYRSKVSLQFYSRFYFLYLDSIDSYFWFLLIIHSMESLRGSDLL